MCENNLEMDMRQDECSGLSVAMAYVPWQHFHKSYEPQRALMVGTIFPELDKPFIGRNGGRGR